MKTLLTYKGIKYLCIAALAPGTAVITHTNNVWINKQVAKVHRPVAVRKPAPRKYVAEVRQPIPATELPIAPVAAIATAECVPGGGGFAGGGGSGGFIGVGGGNIGITPSTPASPTSPVPEPSGWALMILGFGVVGGVMRRKGWTT